MAGVQDLRVTVTQPLAVAHGRRLPPDSARRRTRRRRCTLARAVNATSARRPPAARRGFYSSPPGAARVRRATDVLLLAAALLGAFVLITAQPPTPLERALLRFLAVFPTWMTPAWGFLIGVVALWTVVMIVAPLVSRRPLITL
jgi:hypothetical protein